MPATDKIDLFKSLKTEYASPRQPRLINTSPGRYLSLTGSAVPGSEAYGAHVADLYAVAYTMKFRAKLHGGLDYAVGKLECIWLSLPDARDATTGWRWQLLMRVPDAIGEDDLATTIDALIDKKSRSPCAMCNSSRCTKAVASRCCTSVPTIVNRRPLPSWPSLPPPRA